MKSEHRHELKTNELADWLANLPKWTKQNLKTITYVSAVVIAAAAAGGLWWYYGSVEAAQKQLEFTNTIFSLEPAKTQVVADKTRGSDSSFNLLQLAKNFKAASQNTTNNQMAALALIKQAQAIRTELHYRPAAVTKQDAAAQLDEARNACNQALAKAAGNPSLTASAKFGLGLCEEEAGNFEKARQIYQQIAAEQRLEATTAAAEAKFRLKTMDQYKQPVVFSQKALTDKPSPKTQPSETVQPKIETELADSNLAGG